MENVLVSRSQLQQLLDYLAEAEYFNYQEYIAEFGSGENHIYSIAESVQSCIDAQ